MGMKRRMTKWMVLASVLLTFGVLTVTETAWAQPPGRPGPRAGRVGRRPASPAGGRPVRLGRLDLSEAQREQIRSTHEESREVIRAAEERVQAARQALLAAVTADLVNESTIRVLATELGWAEGDAAVHRAHVHVQVWQVLTAEQQAAARAAEAKMQERMKRRRERMGERRERRQERRP